MHFSRYCNELPFADKITKYGQQKIIPGLFCTGLHFGNSNIFGKLMFVPFEPYLNVYNAFINSNSNKFKLYNKS